MKHILSILIIVLCTTAGRLQAQSKFTLEILAQPQSTMIMGDFKIQVPESSNPEDYTAMDHASTFGFATGVKAAYRLNDLLSLSLGAIYSHQGQDYEDIKGLLYAPDATYSYGHTVSLNYLKVPLVLSYSKLSDKRVTFSCYGGLYMGILLSYEDVTTQTYDNVTFTDPYGNPTYTGSLKATRTINGTSSVLTAAGFQGYQYAGEAVTLDGKIFSGLDVGFTAGAGIEIKLSEKLSLPLMLHYELGLTDVKNTKSEIIGYNGYSPDSYPYWGDSTNPNSSIKFHNSVLGLSAGLKINL